MDNEFTLELVHVSELSLYDIVETEFREVYLFINASAECNEVLLRDNDYLYTSDYDTYWYRRVYNG